MNLQNNLSKMNSDTPYPILVKALCKHGQAIIDDLSPSKAHLWHMGTGVAGEAGEIIDIIKKVVLYGQDPDLTHLKEELGDMEFFLEGIRQIFGLTREEILAENTAKLIKRYGESYSNEAARIRMDKAWNTSSSSVSSG